MRSNTIFIIIAIAVLLQGCGTSGRPANEEVVARVNKDTVTKTDLMRDLALRARFDPDFKISPDTEQEQLESMIEKKLIIQYAMEKGLARDERFVNSIRLIWEHALIKDFIDYKKKEWQDYLFATDDDISRYYDNMSQRVTFKALKSRDRKPVDEAYKKYLKDKDTTGWKVIGPLAYDEIASSAFLDAFEMGKGEAKVFESSPYYYLIEVVERERVDLAPMESMKPEIEKKVVALKERRLFEDWLKDRRKKAKIKINDDALRKGI
ncbi:MAG: SurA N-terminal domain-containing protein [Candidatus Omnitrophota bacterium]